MESLILAGNAFSGPISPICDLLNEHNALRHLDLSENALSGLLPNCWTYGQNMVFLDLGFNMLSGQLPESIGDLVHLKVLTLSNNNFHGEMPNSLRNCTSLFFLNLGNNALSGTFPAWLGESLENLQILLLRRNMLKGNIPPQLCQLKYIVLLDLSSNSLSGRIPSCINNFLVIAEKEAERSSRYYDYASYAKDELQKLMWLATKRRHQSNSLNGYHLWGMDLSPNNLIGEIPGELTELIGLSVLNLSRNHLTGIIPSDIGAISSLEALDLSRNQLSCAIPTSMSDLNFLSILNLSYNKLSGKIPSQNQFSTFDATSFVGNRDLCGPILGNACMEDKSYEDPNCKDKELGGNIKSSEVDEGHGFEIPPFYISMVIGFIAGFWGFWGPLLLSTSWRHAYFRFVGNMIDQIYVWVVVAVARLQRKFQSSQPQRT